MYKEGSSQTGAVNHIKDHNAVGVQQIIAVKDVCSLTAEVGAHCMGQTNQTTPFGVAWSTAIAWDDEQNVPPMKAQNANLRTSTQDVKQFRLQ